MKSFGDFIRCLYIATTFHNDEISKKVISYSKPVPIWDFFERAVGRPNGRVLSLTAVGSWGPVDRTPRVSIELLIAPERVTSVSFVFKWMEFVTVAKFPAVEKLNEVEVVVVEIVGAEHMYRPLYPASGEHKSVE